MALQDHISWQDFCEMLGDINLTVRTHYINGKPKSHTIEPIKNWTEMRFIEGRILLYFSDTKMIIIMDYKRLRVTFED